MPRHITTLQIEFELHRRISQIRDHVSLELRHSAKSLGLGPMLGLLVDHWQQHPPDAEWLASQAALYPKRGRPSRAVNGTVIGNPATSDRMRGHEVFTRRLATGAHKIYFCRHCTMSWSTWDFDRPPSPCPKDGVTISIYQPKRWTKSELLASGFEEDEVAWCNS